MFKDYPHQNTIAKNKANIIVKSLVDKDILYKEFAILEFLQKYNFVPRVSNFDGLIFYEEKIIGREMQAKDLSFDNIKNLALLLKELHTLAIPSHLEKIIQNNFIKDKKYQPTLIVKEILNRAPIELVEEYGAIFYEIARNTEDVLGAKKYNMSIIHGDLSFKNIFLSGKNIFLIDWTDCRLDISSCDVSQLFYLLNFNKEQEKIFLEYYDTDYIDDKLLIFHKTLLFLYDLVDFYLKNNKINNKLLSKLKILIGNFYEG